ncbi:MAG: tRNA (guanine-N(1)-)-methyltransferase [Parcubacteria group bacterium GW2011_GWF2_52_12]|nr:MAG: tRNA (guanine-N(1)-)-methyltransferase [Parcubacteria group bacterium GW2011_GWF2_52_12]
MLKFLIITIFPESLESYLASSMILRAVARNIISAQAINPRDFTDDPHRKADDKPYGGGPGMVMKALPIIRAVSALKLKKGGKRKILIMSPRGRQFTQTEAKKFAKKYDELVLIAGHYEGIDARVKKILKAEEVSVGPYTLTGGELPALIIIDAVSRHVPGVLGKVESRPTLAPSSSPSKAKSSASPQSSSPATKKIYTPIAPHNLNCPTSDVGQLTLCNKEFTAVN